MGRFIWWVYFFLLLLFKIWLSRRVFISCWRYSLIVFLLRLICSILVLMRRSLFCVVFGWILVWCSVVWLGWFLMCRKFRSVRCWCSRCILRMNYWIILLLLCMIFVIMVIFFWVYCFGLCLWLWKWWRL